MPKLQTDYSNTFIYKICCKDPTITDIYIGHTTNFSQRKNHHRVCCYNENSKSYNRYVYQFIRDHGGWDNWKMVQIKEYSFNNKREAEATEHYWIEQLCTTLNINKPYAKCKEEPQLYKHNWYEENKDYIIQKAKVNYEENKEQKLAKAKLYAELHKEEIAEYQKAYIEENKEKIAEQKKIYRESHKEEAAKMQKDWREANKDKLKEQKGQVIICECGQQITAGNKIRHLQSKIHTEYQNKLCETDVPQLPDAEQLELEEEEEEKEKQKTKKQQKQYRETHAEQIKTHKKIHYAQNKEAILEKQRKYKELHKEKVMEQNKQYMEANKEKIQEYKNNWYEENKEKILQKQKETVTCECGAQIRKSGKAEHLRSNKHKDWVTKCATESVIKVEV